MDVDEFWTLLERLQPFERGRQLVRALAGLTGEEVIEFQQHVADAAQALNTSAHHAQPVADTAGDDVPSAIPLGDDAFLSARFAVVASGRQVWAEVAADPSRFAGRWNLGLGYDIEIAIDTAFELVTGEPAPPSDIDEPPDQMLREKALPPLPRRSWLF